MTIDEYRAKHKRCRYCVYCSRQSGEWYCKAKKKFRGSYNVYRTAFAGCFCRLYKAEKEGEP